MFYLLFHPVISYVLLVCFALVVSIGRQCLCVHASVPVDFSFGSSVVLLFCCVLSWFAVVSHELHHGRIVVVLFFNFCFCLCCCSTCSCKI